MLRTSLRPCRSLPMLRTSLHPFRWESGGLGEVGGFLMILPHRKLIDGPPPEKNPRLIMTSVLAAVFYGAASHNLNKCHLTFHRFVEPFQL